MLITVPPALVVIAAWVGLQFLNYEGWLELKSIGAVFSNCCLSILDAASKYCACECLLLLLVGLSRPFGSYVVRFKAFLETDFP